MPPAAAGWFGDKISKDAGGTLKFQLHLADAALNVKQSSFLPPSIFLSEILPKMSEVPGYSQEKSANDLSSPRPSSLHDDRKAMVDLYEDASIDPVYQAKARVLNQAIHEIGMGRYQVCAVSSDCLVYAYPNQWYLFVVAGFGWFA